MTVFGAEDIGTAGTLNLDIEALLSIVKEVRGCFEVT